jgi:hypothetical protein
VFTAALSAAVLLPRTTGADDASAPTATRVFVPGLASAEAGGFVDECGNWTHETELGFVVIEATKGFTYCGPVTVSVPGGEVTIPQADGITWGSGDLPAGYGVEIRMPAGSTIFFGAGQRLVMVRADCDRGLIDQILAAAPAPR